MFAEATALLLLGLIPNDPRLEKPTRAEPERQECLITWIHPDGWLLWTTADVRRDARIGEDVDRDSGVPWPICGDEVLSTVHCLRWVSLRELVRRARNRVRREPR